MKITVHSSKVVKPAAYAGVDAAATTTVIPLTAFDLISYDNYVSSIHAFHPPSPTNAALEDALSRVLAVYREWAGRLCVDPSARRRGILLNDAGVRFVEASSDAAFESVVMPRRGRITPEVRSLHPRAASGGGAAAAEDEELLLLQVTRFACGSLVVGYTMHHAVGDGFAAGQFMAAWGQTARGVPIDPVPVHDRTSFFLPRSPPRVEFDHRASEFRHRDDVDNDNHHAAELKDDQVVIQQVRFSREFISELRSRASGNGTKQQHHHRPYSTAQCLVAHIWRCMTKARGVNGGRATTLHLAVNGRPRMSGPRVPEGYTGNLVLWAHPTATAGELLAERLGHAAELIRGAVARVDNAYFRSFIDFVSSGAVEEEGLVPAAAAEPDAAVLCPDVAVYCLLRAPFYDIDLGGGRQFFYTPGYYPDEGVVYILPPSPLGDGSVEVHVSLFSRAMDVFKGCCYELGQPEEIILQ
nr:unnamed protein product [Digitaria exilis]